MKIKYFILSQGRGCSYTYCTKFLRCSTCSQDPACGWCDSLHQCVPGTSFGPYAEQCPDWFYYTCYTVGSVNHCSNEILVIDDLSFVSCVVPTAKSSSKTCELQVTSKMYVLWFNYILGSNFILLCFWVWLCMVM